MIALQLVFLIPALYLLGLTLFAAVARCRRATETTVSSATGHLAFVVPAHDEEKDIAVTVASVLASQDGDISVHVVADNCTDGTASAARMAGATVWERSDLEKRSKGFALEWVIPRIFGWGEESGHPVAFLTVVDADARLTPNSVGLARAAFASGAQVLQSEYLLDRGEHMAARVAELGFAAMNVVRGLGRGVTGASDTLKGNGMWFKRDILDRFPWKAYSLAEDFEFAIHLIRQGIRIQLLRDSVVTGAPARSHAGLREQRVRWEAGRLALVAQELPVVLRAFARHPSMALLDLSLELMTPPLAFLVAFYGATLVALPLCGVFPWVGIGGILFMTVHVLAAIPLGRLPLATFFVLAWVPFYVIWKLLLLPLIWARRRSKLWVRAARMFPWMLGGLMGASLVDRALAAEMQLPQKDTVWKKANSKVFCTGYGPWIEKDDAADLEPALVRWGGNTSTRFNPLAGNLWNAAADWKFQNQKRGSGTLWRDWIAGHRAAGRLVQFTIPALGWVAKDGTSEGDINKLEPARTSVPLSLPELEGWLKNLRQALGEGERIYPIDNEPFLWHQTHRDLVAKPWSPKAFALRWLEVARTVRRVDPLAQLTGPGLWGYGDLKHLEGFLSEVLGKNDEKGKPLLDIVTTNLYPQAPRLQQDLADITGRKRHPEWDEETDVAHLRLLTVDGVDSSDAVDPSWIAAPVQMIPRMRALIAAVAERKKSTFRPAIAVTEYNWGAPYTKAGGAAQALLLQKFLLNDVDHACTFTWPPADSWAGAAFRAYRRLLAPVAGSPLEISLADSSSGRRLWARDGQSFHLFWVSDKAGEPLPPGAKKVERLGLQGFEVVEKKNMVTEFGAVWHLVFDLPALPSKSG